MPFATGRVPPSFYAVCERTGALYRVPSTATLWCDHPVHFCESDWMRLTQHASIDRAAFVSAEALLTMA